ncbi:MAG: DUF2378 family protein [Myxococcales bacterium]|nr:DUF2378 family protein [Myxococcales bacterium]
MPVAPVDESAFRAPRLDFDIDVEAVAAGVPAGATTKGMYFNRALRLAPPELYEDEILAKAGIELQRFVPFRDYPWTDFFRIAATVGQLIVGEGKVSAGLRKVGLSFYPEFAESVAGKVVFGLLGRYADRVIPLGPKAWSMSATLGQISGESMGDCHYRYHFDGFPAAVAESMSLGIIDGALAFCDAQGQYRIAVLDDMRCVIDIRWSEG